jgi:hypothetical protein
MLLAAPIYETATAKTGVEYFRTTLNSGNENVATTAVEECRITAEYSRL